MMTSHVGMTSWFRLLPIIKPSAAHIGSYNRITCGVNASRSYTNDCAADYIVLKLPPLRTAIWSVKSNDSSSGHIGDGNPARNNLQIRLRDTTKRMNHFSAA